MISLCVPAFLKSAFCYSSEEEEKDKEEPMDWMEEEAEEEDPLELIDISPSGQIVCVGPLKRKRYCHLLIHNPTTTEVAYKIKATSRDYIKFQPGFGYVRPNCTSDITMTATPMEDRKRPPQHEHVTVLIAEPPSNHPRNPMDVWSRENYPERIRLIRLNIKFLVEKPIENAHRGYNDTESTQSKTREDGDYSNSSDN